MLIAYSNIRTSVIKSWKTPIRSHAHGKAMYSGFLCASTWEHTKIYFLTGLALREKDTVAQYLVLGMQRCCMAHIFLQHRYYGFIQHVSMQPSVLDCIHNPYRSEWREPCMRSHLFIRKGHGTRQDGGVSRAPFWRQVRIPEVDIYGIASGYAINVLDMNIHKDECDPLTFFVFQQKKIKKSIKIEAKTPGCTQPMLCFWDKIGS